MPAATPYPNESTEAFRKRVGQKPSAVKKNPFASLVKPSKAK